MPASKLNYLVVYENHSQVYGCSSKKIAIESPPPDGYSEKDKRILFVTVEPDTGSLCVYPVSNEEIVEEEVIEAKKKKQKEKNSD